MSYGIYVGKNRSKAGIGYLAGYGDEPSSHWLEVVPRRTHPPGSTISVGSTPAADMPGRVIEVPQAAETFRHIRVSYSYFKGVPAPITNGGLNEYGVAVRDVWSPSRSELIEMTPTAQTGPNYSDLARVALERCRTAQEGVELIGELIALYGETTYGGNSHIIADADEAWVVIQFAGGQGLWAAERLGPDSIRVSRPGYIGEVPVNDPTDPAFRYSDNLVSFAVSQGWHTGRADQAFNVNTIYGDGKNRWAGVQLIESELWERSAHDGGVSLTDMMWALRTPQITGDTAGYGQIVPLVSPTYPELRSLWHTQIGAIAAPFVPVFMGVSGLPEEFAQHRYLTVDEARRFSDDRHRGDDPDSTSQVPQGIESTRSATASFKRLMYLVLQHHETYLPEVTQVWEATERRLIEVHDRAIRTAGVLLEAEEAELACSYLSDITGAELTRALDLADTMAAGLEARTRAVDGIGSHRTPRSVEQIW